MKSFVFKLYIAGNSPHSQKAITTLQRLCQEVLQSECEFSIVDLLNQPQLAEEEKILATPTLLRLRPEPIRRVIGDLSNLDLVLTALEIQQDSASSSPGTGK